MRDSRTVPLRANQPREVNIGGTIAAIRSITNDATVALRWLGASTGKITPLDLGGKYRPGFRFDGIELTADVDCEVVVFFGDGDADVNLANGTMLIANTGAGQAVPVEVTGPDPLPVSFEAAAEVFINNTAADRVPVDVGGAVINVTATHVELDANGATVDDTNPLPVKLVSEGITTNLPVDQVLGDTLTDNAAVAVTAVLTAVLAADAARRSVRLFNQGPDAVAIGGAGLTWAKRAVVLQVGDMWPEEIAPGAVINAICDAGNTATLGVQVAS